MSDPTTRTIGFKLRDLDPAKATEILKAAKQSFPEGTVDLHFGIAIAGTPATESELRSRLVGFLREHRVADAQIIFQVGLCETLIG